MFMQPPPPVMVTKANLVDRMILKVYNLNPLQALLGKCSLASERLANAWEQGGHRFFHFSFIPMLTFGGLLYSNDLSIGMLIASINPLLL